MADNETPSDVEAALAELRERWPFLRIAIEIVDDLQLSNKQYVRLFAGGNEVGRGATLTEAMTTVRARKEKQ